MNEAAYRRFLDDQQYAGNTKANSLSALKKIEEAEGLDLDAEFAKDGLASLLSKFIYSASDGRAARPNPTQLPIEADRLVQYLSWYRSHLRTYQKFKGAPQSDEPADDRLDADDLSDEVVGQIFGLERDLQSALRLNLDQLEAGLRAIDHGKEHRVEGGLIDIFARDAKGVPTVIELKAETARPAVIAQILAYMSCVAESGSVRGIIVASDFDKRFELAAKAVPNITLKRYRYRFEFI